MGELIAHNPKDQITIADIEAARERLKELVVQTAITPLERHSTKHRASIAAKREDRQRVRSFKIRGAANKMLTMTAEERESGVVCASAGNHAQGVALSADLLETNATIFMPANTPDQKIGRVNALGQGRVNIRLVGETFDDAYTAAIAYREESGAAFVHPFDDPAVIAGQGTIGAEIWEQTEGDVDMVICTIGGGGLISGIGTYLKAQNPDIEIIGVEPAGAAAMQAAFFAEEPVTLDKIDPFVDGAAVRRVGDLTFQTARSVVDEIVTVGESDVSQTMIDLYNIDGIATEPAGALSIAALERLQDQIEGRNIVCILSGANMGAERWRQIEHMADFGQPASRGICIK